MQPDVRPDNTLIVTSTTKWVDGCLLVGAACCTWLAIRDASHGSFNLQDASPLVGTIFFLFGFLAVHERIRFEFNPHLALVRWYRTRLWGRREGRLPFSRVHSVILQTSIGSHAVAPAYRVALVTDEGEIPLTTGYAVGMRQECEAIAGKIRTLLHLSSSSADFVMDSVRAALAQGRTLDAIRLVRLHKGLSLTEAKQFVETFSPASHATVPLP